MTTKRGTQRSYGRKLGAEIRALRKARGWTQDHLGSLVDLTHQAISNIELGRERPGESTLIGLAKALDADQDKFLRLLGMQQARGEAQKSLARQLHLENTAEETAPYTGRRVFPVSGVVSADPEANVVFERDADGEVEFGPETLVWRVSGDSMDPIARNGQHLLVDPDLAVHDGDLVLVGLKDGRTMFKRYWEGDKQSCTLESGNPGGGHRPIPTRRKDIAWINKVVGVKF